MKDKIIGSNHIECCLLTAAVLLLNWTIEASPLTLSAKGTTSYQIVVASNAIPSERYAAEELQRYLEKITDATFSIVTDAGAMHGREILLGDNSHLRKLGLKIDCSQLGGESFILRTDHNRLIIAGGKPRGTLYGVYTLLEEKLGVRWFTPELEFVPQTNRLVLAAVNEERSPALEYREVFWTEIMRDADFAAHHRLNGPNYMLTEKHGGRPVVYFPFVHSFDSLVPPNLYDEHPEYFPLIKGKRKNGYVQRCLSNPEVVKIAKARVRDWIKEHPDATIISVSQNDTANYCECDECKALDEREGSPAASLIQFVNAIAEDIERDYPDIKIDTLAYQYTRKPPKTIRPRPNVIIRLCSIECCFAHSLASCDSTENHRFRDDIVAWEPVAPKLYIWDYTPNFSHYQQPFPNFDVLQPNVQFIVGHGVKGLFEQGNYSPGGYGEMGPLRAYILAKLLWNPQADVQAHTREFLTAYYGHAAPDIRAYIDLLESQVRNGKVHAHIFESPKAAYLNDQFLAAASEIFTRAEQSAENDAVRFRVQVAQLPIWYVQIATDRVTGDARIALLDKFLVIARKAGISNISESKSLDDWAKKMTDNS
ncbi:MAG TPA: DUF4838 domain-containing protein [Candidatus Eisenbacteria bacterium]|nr:DUF4838 domain-containing protein [Candidatus Eisenbacteria bacterium]